MLKRYFKNNQGIAAIEFAIIAPVFLILVLAGFEVGRYVMLINKLQSTGYALANIVAQTEPASRTNACLQSRLTEDKLENIVSGAPSLMRPFSYEDSQYKVIITSLERTPSGLGIRWKKEYGALAGAESEIGGAAPGPCQTLPCPTGNANVPATVSSAFSILQPGNNVRNGENVVALEMFYRYQPIFPKLFGIVSDAQVFKEGILPERVYFYSRLGKLEFLPPTYMPVNEIPCDPGAGAGA